MQTRRLLVTRAVLPSVKICISIVLINVLFTLKCISQTDIANFETAATTPVNQVRTNLSYGMYLFSYGGETELIFNQANLSLGIGVTKQVELKLSYSYIHHDKLDNLYLIQVTPKYCGESDLMAFKAIAGIFIEKQDQRYSEKRYKTFYRFSPRFLITPIATPHFDITITPAFDVMFGKNIGGGTPAASFGINLGFGFSSNMDVWSLRPEIGMMKGTSEGNNYGLTWSSGLGLSFTF